MKLDRQFKEFLREIKPTEKQKEDWKSGAKTLRTRLAADDKLKDVVVSTFLQGSIRRSTALRPTGDKRPDVDIVVVTNIDYTQTTPEEAMGLFAEFLDKHYAGKWREQGRSFGIELSYVDMDLVITALPRPVTSEHNRHMASFADTVSFADIYRSEAANSLSTLEEDTSWRLNPRWRERQIFDEFGGNTRELASHSARVLEDETPSGWKENPLWLPDRETKEWGRTHPLLQISWTAQKNRRTNETYLNIVRAIKWWRLEIAEKLPKYPKGYPLEHMVGHLLDDGADLTTAHGIVQVFEACRDKWLSRARRQEVPFLSDHGVEEHNVLARLSPEDFEGFVEIISDFAAVVRYALEAEDSTQSGELWQQVFGSKFPLPSPSGGDRVPAQFIPPPAMPEAPRTERFA